MRNIDDASFLFLEKEKKEKAKRGMKPHPKCNLVRIKKGGKCATKKEDLKHKKEGWKKVGCGMWIMPVEVE